MSISKIDKRWIGVVIMFVGILLAAYKVAQDNFISILTAYFLSFLGYFILSRYRFSLRNVLIIGLVARILLLGAFPLLSDDIYRFFWDGKLILSGINPYSILPSEVDTSKVTGLDGNLFSLLNSPHYYSVYPPMAQLIFVISAIGDLWLAQIIMKIILIIADILAFRWLWKVGDALNISSKGSMLYFLNPLLIIEGVGNLHFEGLMMMFFIGFIYYTFLKPHLWKGSALLALAITTKLLPLIALPYLFFHKKWKIIVLTMAFLLFAFSPLLIGLDVSNFLDSVGLYFNKFEFNASIYYLLRELGYKLSGYNLITYIGPFLGVVATVLIINKARLKPYGLAPFIKFMFYALSVYLICATTVHPWYLIPSLMMAVLIDKRWMVFWTALVILSYGHYSGMGLWIIAVEYCLLSFFLLWEKQYIFKNKVT